MLKPTSLQAAFGFTLLHEEGAPCRNQNPKRRDKIQEIVEVLEERKEQVQPQKETAQELEPVFATEKHPVVQSEELVEEYREEIPRIEEFQLVTVLQEDAIGVKTNIKVSEDQLEQNEQFHKPRKLVLCPFASVCNAEANAVFWSLKA
jgi:hypothetical protein